jgi:hypothetical protein
MNSLIESYRYSVGHFSELIYQGAVCRLWKKIADESLLWFSLEFKYSIPNDYIESIKTILRFSGTLELVWNPNSPQPPSSLPLGIYDLIFQVNTTSIISRNHKTASKLRMWFISYVIYHKKYWKWYRYWKPFICPPAETQQFIEHLKTGLRLSYCLPTIICIVLSCVTSIETHQLADFFFSTRSIGAQFCGLAGYLSVTVFQLFSCYFENIRTLNRPKETLVRALFARDSPIAVFIMEIVSWIVVFFVAKPTNGNERATG